MVTFESGEGRGCDGGGDCLMSPNNKTSRPHENVSLNSYSLSEERLLDSRRTPKILKQLQANRCHAIFYDPVQLFDPPFVCGS